MFVFVEFCFDAAKIIIFFILCKRLSDNSLTKIYRSDIRNIIKVSSQSRKSEFRAFSIVHLNIDNF